MNNLGESNKVYFDIIKEIASKSEEIISENELDKAKNKDAKFRIKGN